MPSLRRMRHTASSETLNTAANEPPSQLAMPAGGGNSSCAKSRSRNGVPYLVGDGNHAVLNGERELMGDSNALKIDFEFEPRTACQGSFHAASIVGDQPKRVAAGPAHTDAPVELEPAQLAGSVEPALAAPGFPAMSGGAARR